MFKKLLHGKRKSALLNLTWSGLLCRVVWSVSQLLYLLQRAGHFKFFSPSFFVGLELIAPALDRLEIGGRTTIEIVEAGNIRIDMFQRLLTADLVVADLSIHHANVFYELGIRHALCDRHTFMLRCRQEKFPFDLQTDRYFEYSKEAPGASLESFVEAIRRTIDSNKADSPVFLALPNLRAQDPVKFLTVPLDFGEEVERNA